MATAYLVTTGEYSDYRVEAVFTTREGAERLAAKYPKDHASVEERTLDEYPEYPEGLLRYRVQFDMDGNSWARHVDPDAGFNDECNPGGDDKSMATWCWANSEEHAIKIANERRAKVIANGFWAPTWETFFALQRKVS
jgi:hypothetical protein